MKKVIQFFRVQRSERGIAVLALIYAVVLNALVIAKYYDAFSQLGGNYHKRFVELFHISGFDPLSYEVVSQWTTAYNIYRHPLLAFMMWIPAQVNAALSGLLGVNAAQFVVGAMLVVCAFYSIVFLFRILREVVGVAPTDAWLTTLLMMSLGYVMVTVSVPDHFTFSLLMLTITLYVAGRAMVAHRQLSRRITIVLFFLTAGISLNNGIKVFLANVFVNGKRALRPLYAVLTFVLPALLLWGVARMEWRYYEAPHQLARNQQRMAEADREHARIAKAFRDTTQLTNPDAVQAGIQRIIKQQMRAQYIADHKKPWNQHKGKPLAKGEFSQWTDITTPRWQSVTDNLWGESLMLHADHLLQDTLRARPVFVAYRGWWNPVAEGLLALLFVAGIWAGRRARFLWLALSFFAFDLLIHVGLGFGLNEVYIMTAHWAYVIPIAVGYLLRAMKLHSRSQYALRVLLACLVAFLFVWNLRLYVGYLLG